MNSYAETTALPSYRVFDFYDSLFYVLSLPVELNTSSMPWPAIIT